jgi:hypothetical protein
MPVCEHIVSYRNGPQVMVAGLSLAQALGYCRNARVRVTDPTGNPANGPWEYIVPNDERATLVCRKPRPPAWIQPGILIRIDVQPPAESIAEGDPGNHSAACLMSVPAACAAEDSAALHQPRPALLPHVVYAVDVGAPGGGLAWARFAPEAEHNPCGSMNYDVLVDLIIRDLRADLPVALGFEAPMFLPVAPTIGGLTGARLGEPAAWSFGAGACVTTVAIPLMAMTLRRIRSQLNPAPRVGLDAARWLDPDAPRSHLLLWEAFVSGAAHARGPNAAGLTAHLQDAATAVHAFVQWERANPRPPSDVSTNEPISTVGTAMLWSGLDSDLGLLHQQVLVLRPTQLLGADVVAYVPGR